MALRVFLLCALIACTSGLNNGLGRTPAMGYNTWNDLRCDGITSANVKAIVDKMAELGLGKLGYEYVNIDDCWSDKKGRDENGRLVPAPSQFPEGMKALSDYVHSKGYKMGIYTDRGDLTCAGYPGSRGYEMIDALTFAEWGVDYLKEDSCYATKIKAEAFYEYTLMRDALNATNRPIYFSMCGWNPWYAYPDDDLHYKGGAATGNSWRTTGDAYDWVTTFNNIQINAKLAAYAGPGGWNDPDMLIGSSPGTASVLLPHQSRMMFSLWCVMAAPLLIGSKLTNLTAFDLETYTNKDAIRVDQDPLGIQGRPVVDTCPQEELSALVEKGRRLMGGRYKAGMAYDPELEIIPDCHQVWMKPLHTGATAVALVNYGVNATRMHVDFGTVLGITGKAHVKDLWLKRTFPAAHSYEELVAGNGGSSLLLVTPVGTGEDETQQPVQAIVVADDVL